MKKRIIIAVVVLVLLALAGPFMPLEFLRPRIASALTQSLGRQVEIDSVSFTLFPAPALALGGVTIHEDPRAGIEPFTYAENVDAQVNLLGLFGGRKKFSQLRFTGASLNLVKADGGTSGGQWNFQYLLNTVAGADVPSVQMRAGRVNIKFGQTKSVLYFDDADVDISVADNGAIDLRFSGEPERTDRPAEMFGHFFVRGTVAPSNTGQQTNMRVELEPSTLDSLARLLGATGLNLHGQVALNGQITGPASNLEIKGDLEFRDDRRTSVLPQFGGTAKLGLQGVLDVTHQTLRIVSSPVANRTFSLQMEASKFLAAPQWAVTLDLQEAPLAALYGGTRQIGVPIPDKLVVTGTVSGSVQASSQAPLAGEFTLTTPSVTTPSASQMKAETALVSITGDTISLKPAMIDVGEKESATLEASYKIGADNEADAKITTRGLTIAAAYGLDLSGVPLVGQMPQGIWRGVARFHRASSGENKWTGEYELLNARVSVDGLAEPVRIISASVNASNERTVVSRIRASAGKIGFTGDYRWEPMAESPHQFHIQIDPADGVELERLFKPTLERTGGFLERTLGLGAAPPPPEWLATRHAEGTVTIRSLKILDHVVAVDSSRVVWDGTVVTITGLKGRVDEDVVTGTLNAELVDRTPKYHFDGRYQASAYKGGKLDVKGTVDATGTGVNLLASLHAQGAFDGRTIQFSPDAEFRSITGSFDARVAGTSPRWKFTKLEGAIGADMFIGEGASQPDGKVALDLTSRGRQVKYTGPLAAAQP